MAERTIALVLKTRVLKGTVGSNPTLSVMSVQTEIEACKSKVRYGTEEAAKRVAIAEMAKPKMPDLFVYRCPRPGCDGFHLTRQPQ